MYYCRAISNLTDPKHYLLPENLIVREILNTWGPNSRVSLLNVEKYLAPYSRVKYGNCGGYHRVDIIDCVHYCAWVPTAWVPIWYDMLNIVENFKEQTTVLSENEGNRIVYLKDSDPKMYYYINHGLKRFVPDMYSLQKYLKQEHISMQEEAVTQKELDLMPTGMDIAKTEFYADGTLVEAHKSKEIFVVEGGMRRSIPNWDTFLYNNFSAAKIKFLPLEAVLAIPLGEPLPACTNC